MPAYGLWGSCGKQVARAAGSLVGGGGRRKGRGRGEGGGKSRAHPVLEKARLRATQLKESQGQLTTWEENPSSPFPPPQFYRVTVMPRLG